MSNNKKNDNKSAPVYQTEQIPVSEFTYSQVVPSKNGPISNVFLNYNKGRPKIQTPMLYCPFGVSCLEVNDRKNADPAYSVELQLGSDNPKTIAFTEWLESLDNRVLADGQKNSSTWMPSFKGKMSEKMAKKLYKPLVKRYFDKEQLAYTDKYPARVKFKLNRKNGRFTTRFFDHNRQPLDVNALTPEELDRFGKGYRMRVIFEVGGIWGGAKGFGVTLRADQVMIYPPQKLTGFGFVDDVEDELIFGGGGGGSPSNNDNNNDEPAEPAEPAAEESEGDAAPAPESEGDGAESDAGATGDQAEPEEEEEQAPAAESSGEAEQPEEEEEEEAQVSDEPEPEPAKKKVAKKTTAAGSTDNTKQSTLGKYSRKKK